MSVIVEGQNQAVKKEFTEAEKAEFASAIKLEKKKLMLLSGAAHEAPEDRKATLRDYLKKQYPNTATVSDLKYAPLRIAVQDAIVWSDECELEF